MFTLIRTVCGGPKNRYKQDGYNLDLTYITPNIIAMSFPSTGLQSVYRNDLQEVAEFLHKKHSSNYMIINVSNRKYQYERFHGQVKDYFWPNHQTPELVTLFQICFDVSSFLSGIDNFIHVRKQKNVVIFHCNHGKGRTGTAIISYLLYSGYFPNLKTTIHEYNTKRFSNSYYQIDIPCQVRYLEYFERILKSKDKIDFNKIRPLRLTTIQTNGISKSDDIFVRLLNVKEGNKIGEDIKLTHQQTYVKMQQLLIGDIKLEIYTNKLILGQSKIGYINFNTYFREKIKQKIEKKALEKQIQYTEYEKIAFRSDQIKKKWGWSKLNLTLILKQVNQGKISNNENCLNPNYKVIRQKIKQQKDNFQLISKIIKNKYDFL